MCRSVMNPRYQAPIVIMKIPLVMLAVFALMSCSCAEKKPVTMQLVYQYPSSNTDPYYGVIRQLASASRLSLKIGQRIYYDGQHYYVYRQQPGLWRVRVPKTDADIVRHSIMLSKEKVARMLDVAELEREG